MTAGCVSSGACAPWSLYLLLCENGALYAGIATDVLKRFEKHKSGKGAKYTRANPPLKVVASCGFSDRSAAQVAEARVKKLKTTAKVAFVLAAGGALH